MRVRQCGRRCVPECAPRPRSAQGTSLTPPEPGHGDAAAPSSPLPGGHPAPRAGLALGAPSWRQEGSPAHALRRPRVQGTPPDAEPRPALRAPLPSVRPSPARPARACSMSGSRWSARSRDREESWRLQGGAAEAEAEAAGGEAPGPGGAAPSPRGKEARVMGSHWSCGNCPGHREGKVLLVGTESRIRSHLPALEGALGNAPQDRAG